jgi:hypothetical protein
MQRLNAFSNSRYGFLYMTCLFFLGFVWSGCGKDCATEECPPPVSKAIFFQLQNNAGDDLLAGPAKQYDTANIRISAKRAGSGIQDSVSRVFVIYKNKAGTADSLIYTGFSVKKNYDVYYLSLKGILTDSLYFGYNPSPSECCDLSSFFLDRINQTDVNNLILPTNYIIRK